MVKKGSIRGLNTGNTVRKNISHRHQRKYGCLVVKTEDIDGTISSKASQQVINDFSVILPSLTNDDVEFSLNKKRRWEFPELLLTRIENEMDSSDIKVS